MRRVCTRHGEYSSQEHQAGLVTALSKFKAIEYIVFQPIRAQVLLFESYHGTTLSGKCDVPPEGRIFGLFLGYLRELSNGFLLINCAAHLI